MASNPTLPAVPSSEPVPPFVIGVSGPLDFSPGDELRNRLKAVVRDVLLELAPIDRAGNKPCPLWRTPVEVLSSLAPGADTLVAEVAEELEAGYQRLRAPVAAAEKAEDDEAVRAALEGLHKARTTISNPRILGKREAALLERLRVTLARPRMPEWRFRVVAPLPYPAEIYRKVSTFTGSRGTEHDKKEAIARMDRLVGQGRAFVVELEEDRGLDDDALKRKLEAENGPGADEATARFRRHLRYRAAGEYIAAHSNMMVILDHHDPSDDECGDPVTVPIVAEMERAGAVESGAATILAMKRQGGTPGLLATEVGFTWADAGPVVHILAPRPVKEGEPPSAAARRPGERSRVYPVDSRPQEDDQRPGRPITYGDPDWQAKARALFRSILGEYERFNVQVVEYAPEATEKEAGELDRMVALPEGPAGEAFKQPLDRLARARRRAADLADKVFAPMWEKLLLRLFQGTLFAALLMHFAVHWHAPATDATREVVEKSSHLIQFVFGTVAVVILALMYLFFLRYKHSGHESARFDYRALAEGLRVQFYWAAAGLNHSVPANYMQRQRTEMAWIRRAVTALAAPYSRWPVYFAALGRPEKLALLKSVVARWIRWDKRLEPRNNASAQAGYMEKTAAREERREHFWRRMGFDMALIGVVQAALWVAWLSPWLHEHLHELFAGSSPPWLHATGVVLPSVFAFLVVFGLLWAALGWNRWLTRPRLPRPEKWEGSWRLAGFVWLRRLAYHDWLGKGGPAWARPALRWCQTALIVAAACLVTAWACKFTGGSRIWMPEANSLWLLVFGTFLIMAGLAIAWPERKLMAEKARQYQSMAALYQAAGRRLLGHLLEAENALEKGDPATFDDRVKAVQELLYQVGLQALDENAEWLILHRSRPLEPLMAG